VRRGRSIRVARRRKIWDRGEEGNKGGFEERKGEVDRQQKKRSEKIKVSRRPDLANKTTQALLIDQRQKQRSMLLGQTTCGSSEEGRMRVNKA